LRSAQQSTIGNGSMNFQKEESFMKKISLLLFVAILALAACGAPTPAPQATSAPAPANTPAPQTTTAAVVPAPTAPAAPAAVGGTFIEGSFADAKTMNSILSSDTTSSRVIKTIGNSLLQVKADLTPECDLCESFTVSPDSLKITFKLKKGVKFHDGTELTADDVKYVYDSILNPDNASPRRGGLKDYLTSADSIKVIDPSTIEFTFAKVKADTLVSDFGYQVFSKKALGGTAGQDFINNDFNTKKPVYTGPFMFKEWVKDDHLTVVANPNYFKGKPKMDAYILKIIPDQAAGFAQLKTGDVDYATIQAAQMAEAKKLPNVNAINFDVFNFDFIAFNLDTAKSPFFQDKKVRQALLLAVDRKAIVDSQYFGYATLANTSMPLISWAYNKDNKPTYDYDPKKAAAMLDEAGWKAGPDGIRVKDGKKFSFTIWTNAGNNIREAIIVACQQYWKEVGVEVKTQTEEWNAFLKRIGAAPDGTRDYDAFLVGFQWGVDPSQRDMWHSEGGFNLNKYNNPDINKVLDDALATLDQSKRKDFYFKMQQIVAEDVPSMILYFPQATVGMNKRVSGYKPAPGNIPWNNLHEWTLGPKTQ
jgi:peptide/nickel transport system substrate-binding protein